MSKFEWNLNQHRDTYASYLGHYDMLSYFAVAQNDSIGRVRYQMLEVCLGFFLYFRYISQDNNNNNTLNVKIIRKWFNLVVFHHRAKQMQKKKGITSTIYIY